MSTLRKFIFTKCLFIVLVLTTASADSPAATVDSETITLNSGTLQTFEILPVSNYFKKQILAILCIRKISWYQF